jgi:hypothetical protein
MDYYLGRWFKIRVQYPLRVHTFKTLTHLIFQPLNYWLWLETWNRLFGGSTQDGGDVVEVDAHITDVTITSNTNEAITFSATLTLSDEPTIGKFTT